MAHTAEMKRVQTLLNHAKQLSGANVQADERIKGLSSRLEELKKLAGEDTSAASEEAITAEETTVDEEATVEEKAAAVDEAEEEVAATEEQEA